MSALRKKNRQKYLFQGKMRTVGGIAALLGVSRQCLSARLSRGWDEALAFSSEKNDQKARLTFEGRTETIEFWANFTGLPKSTISSRLNNLGWSIGKTLSTPKLNKFD